MKDTVCTNSAVCEREKIIAYLEGELSAPDELRFEAHLLACAECLAELNEQKRLLSALETAFEENFVFDEKNEVELPKDFAKKVAVRAESDFQGLRRPRNFVHAVLLILGLFGTGFLIGGFLKRSEFSSLLLEHSAKVIFAVGNFLAVVLFDISLSFVVIARTLSRHILLNSGYAGGFAFLFFLLTFFILSRLLLRFPKS